MVVHLVTATPGKIFPDGVEPLPKHAGETHEWQNSMYMCVLCQLMSMCVPPFLWNDTHRTDGCVLSLGSILGPYRRRQA
jgi:hypothetical protein